MSDDEEDLDPVVDLPLVTAKTYGAGTRDPILRAFISGDARVNGTRNLTEAQWAELYGQFRSAPR